LIIKIGIGLLVVSLLGFGIKEAWGTVITKESVEQFLSTVNDSSWTLPLLFIIFLLAGLLMISVNLILVSATLVIGPWEAFACGFIASILSAVAAFYIGGAAGQPLIEKFFGDRFRKLSDKIQNRGIISIALLRIVPIAPFVVINLVAGISKMKLRIFVAGSCLGMLPGMAGVVFVTSQAKSVFKDPTWETWALLILGVVFLIGLSVGVKKIFKK